MPTDADNAVDALPADRGRYAGWLRKAHDHLEDFTISG
jgi:hypothetical protein